MRRVNINLPLGWVNSSFSTPALIALLNWESKTLWEVTLILLFDWTYFLIAWRLKQGKFSQWLLSEIDGARIQTDPRGIGDGRKTPENIPATISFFQLYTQRARVSNEIRLKLRNWFGCAMPKGKDVSRSGARPESQQPARRQRSTHVNNGILDHICITRISRCSRRNSCAYRFYAMWWAFRISRDIPR